MRLLVVIALAASVARAQTTDVFDLPWRVGDSGELEVQMLANGVGAAGLQFGRWEPLFPGLFQRGRGENTDLAWITDWGPMIALPLLVHGSGGAAAIDEATHRMRKLGTATTVDRATLRQLRPDAQQDLLRVQHLASVDVLSAAYALTDLARDEQRDSWVRAAAASALAQHADADLANAGRELLEQRNGSSALQASLTRLPDDIDLVIGVHAAALPRMAPLLAAWRRMVARLHSHVDLIAGGSLGPYQIVQGQLAMDRPGQLPFEIARRCGNWRVDHAVLGVRAGAARAWWIHLGGVFQPESVATGLRAGDFAVSKADKDEVRGVVHGWCVHVTPSTLEAWPEHFEPGPRGKHLPSLHARAAPGAAPIWAFAPAASRFAADVGVHGASLDARYDPRQGTVSFTAQCADATVARQLLRAWSEWQAQRRCEPDAKITDTAEETLTWRTVAESPPGCCELERSRLVWRRLVQAVETRHEGNVVTWELGIAATPIDDLVRLLGASPANFVVGG